MAIIQRYAVFSALLAATVLLTACGGGGSGTVTASQPPPTSSPGDNFIGIDTTAGAFGLEYDAQYGLRQLNIAAANDSGLTGLGVRMAVVDTGIDASHTEFRGRRISGFNFGSTDSSGYLTDSDGHGTHVAAIMAANRDGLGMRGVAYDAALYAYKISSSTGVGGSTTTLPGVATDAAWTNVINQHSTDRIQVSNNSWGSSSTIDTISEGQLRATYQSSIPALVQAQQQGTIFVFAAGNSGDNNPSLTGAMPALITELKPQWLVTVAVDENLREPAFTDRCGMAADFCVTAPGVNIFSAEANNVTGYTTLSGTSMAAPHVAGVVALVLQQFPELTAAEVTNRVKVTSSLENLTGFFGCTMATCGDSSMRAIFGHGLVNAQAATSPIGTLIYTTDGNVKTTSGHAVGTTALMVPAGLGQQIARQLQRIDVAVFDSFDGATFRVTADKVFNTQQQHKIYPVGYSTASLTLHNAQSIAPFSKTITSQSGALPHHISFATNAFTAISATTWGDKAGLMAQPALMSDQAMQQFEWGLVQTDRLSVRPFTQFSQNNSGELMGAGINLSIKPISSVRAHLSIAKSQSYMASNINRFPQSTAVAVNVAEFGLEHDITPNVSVFARSRLTELGSTSASTQQWGIKGGQIFQHHLGVEFKVNQIKLAVGAYDPGQMRNTQIALLLPDSRTPEGRVNYKEQRFDVSQKTQVGVFLAAKANLHHGATSFGTVTFGIQQSPYESSKVGRASLTYTHQF